MEGYDGPGGVAGDVAADAGHGSGAGEGAYSLRTHPQLGDGVMEQGCGFGPGIYKELDSERGMQSRYLNLRIDEGGWREAAIVITPTDWHVTESAL